MAARRLDDDPEKYSADQLAAEYGLRVLDPDGWRNARVWWDEPITHREFLTYAMNSTIEIVDFKKYKTAFFTPPIARGEL